MSSSDLPYETADYYKTLSGRPRAFCFRSYAVVVEDKGYGPHLMLFNRKGKYVTGIQTVYPEEA